MEPIDPLAVKRRIAHAREAAGLSQPEFADLLEVHVNSVRNWEGSGGDPDVLPYKRISAIAQVLGVSVLWLLFGTDAATAKDATSLLVDTHSRVVAIQAALTTLLEADVQAEQRPPTSRPSSQADAKPSRRRQA